MTAYIIISAIAFLGSVILGAREGYRDAKIGTDIDHSKDFKKRLIKGIIVSVAVNVYFVTSIFKAHRLPFLDSVLFYVLPFAFMLGGLGFVYGFFLDLAFNSTSGHKPTYVGNTAITDKIARDKGLSEWFVVSKLVAGLVCIFFFYAWVLSR